VHPNKPWSGHLIWTAPHQIKVRGLRATSMAADEVGLFRRSFVLDSVPKAGFARVFADARFVLSVNGLEVARGPARSQPRRRLADRIDLAPHLRVGQNCVTAVVRHYGAPTAWWAPVVPTYTIGGGVFLFEAELGDHGPLMSDAEWRVFAGTAWQPSTTKGIGSIIGETFDARELPKGWTDPSFDDSTWSPATVLQSVHIGGNNRSQPPLEPYGAIRTSSLPPLAIERLEFEVIDGVVTDLGGVVFGSWEITADVSEGSKVTFELAEELTADGGLGEPRPNRRIEFTAAGDAASITSIDAHGGRYVRVSVPNDEAASLRIACNQRQRPRTGGAYFRCSDERLNQIYEIGKRTVDACAHDAYVDCPTREQRSWTGDFVVHQMVDFATNENWTLALHHPWLTASPRHDGMLPMAVAGDLEASDSTFIPDWPLHWIRAVHNVMMWAGDRQLVAELLPVAEGVLRWFEPYLGPSGLLTDVSGWALIDWATMYATGESASMNALWARGLRDVAQIAEWLGQQSTATWAREHHETIRANFEQFYDPDRAMYREQLVGPGERVISQHANATAIDAGLVPADRVAIICAQMMDRSRLVRHSSVMGKHGADETMMRMISPYPSPPWNVEKQILAAEPFFRYIVHDALVRAGEANRIGDACLDWSPWALEGATTWPETWHGGTHCHGWSSTPTRDLVTAVLGARPGAPGFASVIVDPQLGGLEWAEGALPTPHGLVTVSVERGKAPVVTSPVPVMLSRS
jgi:alpha-L-rhamnosidase